MNADFSALRSRLLVSLAVIAFSSGCVGVVHAAPPGASQSAESSGWTLLESNQVPAAAGAFHSALASDPHDIDALNGLATINRMQDQSSAAARRDIAVLLAAPQDPRGWFDLHDALQIENAYGIQKGLSASLSSIAASSSFSVQVRTTTLLALAHQDQLLGEQSGAAAIWSGLGYIRDWRVIGPFDNISKSGFKKPFSPESAGIDYASSQVGKNDLPLQWRSAPLVDADGTVEIGRTLGDSGADIYYAATAVESDMDRPVDIWFDPSGASKIWLNGALVLSDNVYRNKYWENGEAFCIEAHLKAGWNTILVKIADDDQVYGNFALRIADPATGEALRLKTSPEKVQTAPVTSFAATGTGALDPVLVALAKQASPTLQNTEALGELQQDYGDYDAALVTLHRAVQMAPNESWLQWEYSQILTECNQSDDARTAREAARADYDGNVPAQTDYLADDQVTAPADEKIALARSLLKRFPMSVKLLSSLSALLGGQNLTDQSITCMRQAYLIAPGENYADQLDSSYSDAGRIADEATLLKSAIASLPGSSKLVLDEADMLIGQGSTSHAVALYRRAMALGASPVQALSEIESAYDGEHDTADAIITIKEQMLLRPEDAGLRSDLGDHYADAANKAQAIAMYSAAIALDPSQVQLRDKIRSLQGLRPIIDLAPALDGDMLIAQADAAQHASQGASTGSVRFILDECREVVYPDGATDARTHEIIRIQDHSAVDDFSSYALDVPSSTAKVTVDSARLIKADGKIIYPDTDNSSSSNIVDFPSLDTGDTIDISYEVTDYISGALAHNFWTDWYFDNHDADVTVSRFALVIPSSMKFQIISHGQAPQDAPRTVGNWTVHEWKVTNLPAVPIEPLTPGERDIGNWIDISTIPSWQDISAWYADLATSACTPDDDIRAKAQELTQGATSDDDKIKAVVKYVRSLRYESTPFRLSAFVPTDGKEVISERYGDCKDKAALICSLLGSLGIQAEMVLLSPRDAGITPELPSPRFDHAIARIKVGDDWQWVDATADQLPYGFLPADDQGVPALPIDPATTDLITSPIEDINKEVYNATIAISLEQDGSLKGSYTADMHGNNAWMMRTVLLSVPDSRRDVALQGICSYLFPQSTYESGSLTGLDDPDGDVIITVNFDCNNYAATTGNLYLLKMPWPDPATDLKYLDVPTPRTTPIEVANERGIETDTVQLMLPPGFEAVDLDAPQHIQTKWGSMDMTFTSANGVLSAVRTITTSVQRVDVGDVPGYVNFLKQQEALSFTQVEIKRDGT